MKWKTKKKWNELCGKWKRREIFQIVWRLENLWTAEVLHSYYYHVNIPVYSLDFVTMDWDQKLRPLRCGLGQVTSAARRSWLTGEHQIFGNLTFCPARESFTDPVTRVGQVRKKISHGLAKETEVVHASMKKSDHFTRRWVTVSNPRRYVFEDRDVFGSNLNGE